MDFFRQIVLPTRPWAIPKLTKNAFFEKLFQKHFSPLACLLVDFAQKSKYFAKKLTIGQPRLLLFIFVLFGNNVI